MTWTPARPAKVTVLLGEYIATIDREIAKLLWRYTDPKTQAEMYNCISLEPVPSCMESYMPDAESVLVATDGYRLVVTPAYAGVVQSAQVFSPSFLQELKAWTKKPKKEAPTEVRATRSELEFPKWGLVIPPYRGDALVLTVDEYAASDLATIRGSAKYMNKDIKDRVIFPSGDGPAYRKLGGPGPVNKEPLPGTRSVAGADSSSLSTKFLGEIAQLWPGGFEIASGGSLRPCVVTPTYDDAPVAYIVVMPQRED
jgi:hypothetical protein